MVNSRIVESLADHSSDRRIVLVVMDGLGGLPHPETGLTELETARTPVLDSLAERSSLGMLLPVASGVTPGSGPAHLSLFGYDPIHYSVGRGALSALGVGIELQPGDVAARLNLATLDPSGAVVDRRAGRPSDDEGRRIVAKIMAAVEAPEGTEVTFYHEKEHRVVFLIRGDEFEADLVESDPLETGLPPHRIEATASGSDRAAECIRSVMDQVHRILADEDVVNGVLARGFAAYSEVPSVQQRFGLRATAIAKYPMYRGVARLVGMTIEEIPASTEDTVTMLEGLWGDPYDLFFLHFKDTDTRGHDGDFDGKVRAIEEIDSLLDRVAALEPDVLVVTGDHSTPATYGEHSWHHVPTLLCSTMSRPTASSFGEAVCRAGDLGVIHGTELMPLALAHAGRLTKYGA